MRIKKRYIIMVVCWVIFIIVALYFNRGENNYNFSYMNQAALIIDNNYDGKIELITPNPELTGAEKTEKKKVIANTYVYCSADSTSASCGELAKGDEVLVYSSEEGWFKISYNGRVAYVLSAAIEVPEEPTTPKPTVKPTVKPTQPPTTQPTTPAPTEPTQPSEEPSTPEEGTTGEGETPSGGEEDTSNPDETPSGGDEDPSIPDETPSSGEENPSVPDETPSSGEENPSVPDETPTGSGEEESAEAGGDVPGGDETPSESEDDSQSGGDPSEDVPEGILE